jgi:DNA-binding transcriptional ArsR family regulator
MASKKRKQSRERIEQGLVALGDPMRQQIVELLKNGARSVQALADELPVTRPAVSRHLRVLSEAGLVSSTSQGTRNLYSLDPAGLQGMRDYMDALWTRALQRYRGDDARR